MDKRFLLSAAVALLTLTGCHNGNQQTTEIASPSFDEVLTSRRSIRAYDATKKISEAEVRELLLATQEAPSWANQQPTKYYVAISEEKLKAVQNMVGGKHLVIARPYESAADGELYGSKGWYCRFDACLSGQFGGQGTCEQHLARLDRYYRHLL